MGAFSIEVETEIEILKRRDREGQGGRLSGVSKSNLDVIRVLYSDSSGLFRRLGLSENVC